MGKAKTVKKTNDEPKNFISAEDFITAWQKSDTIDEVVATTKVASPQYARTRAASYRKKGIPLKMFPGHGRGAVKLDIEALTKLAKSLAPKKSASA